MIRLCPRVICDLCLFTGDSRLNAGETGSQFLLRQTITSVRLANGAVAGNIVDAGSVAQATFLVTQGTRTVGGVLTPQFVINFFNRFFFQLYPQFAGGVNVIDNNDRSRYNALEVLDGICDMRTTDRG